MSISDIREKLYTRKEIRDYFLDKEYGKISGLKFVYRKVRDSLCSFSIEEVKNSGLWVLCSVILSGAMALAISSFESLSSLEYGLSVGIIFFCATMFTAFIDDLGICSTDKMAEIFEKYIIPLWFSYLFGFYFINPSLVMGGLISIYGILMLYPLTFGLTKSVFSLIKNSVGVIFKPDLKKDLWENLKVEDHRFLSQYITEDELVIFLKEIKSYNDLPITEMNKLRIKNRETVENIRKDTLQKELECKKEEKVKAYASTFYNKLK